MFARLALTLALFALPALGAGPLDASRSAQLRAREQVNGVRASQMGKRQELNQLSARIEALKGESRGRLLPGGELDAALKRSQELSDALSALTQTLAQSEGELENANLALLGELSTELTRLRADFDRQTDRQARLVIIKRLREARAEREQVRAALPAAKVPALVAEKPSDDPEDLLEQADLMRDREDQVRKELKSLEVRIAERKEERDLDRRVNQFLGDDAMFDDQDRRLRIRRETTLAPAAAADTATGFTANSRGADAKTPITVDQVGTTPEAAKSFDAAAQGAPTTMGAAAPPSNEVNDFGGAGAGGAGGTNSPGSDPAAAPQVKVSSGRDARPTVNRGTRIAGGEDEDLEDLEIQRAKLKGLAEELKARARALDKKAAGLR